MKPVDGKDIAITRSDSEKKAEKNHKYLYMLTALISREHPQKTTYHAEGQKFFLFLFIHVDLTK